MIRIHPTGWPRTTSRSPMPAATACIGLATALDLVSKYIGAGEDTEHTQSTSWAARSGPRPPTGPRQPPRTWRRASSSSTPSASGRRATSPGLSVAAGVRGRLRLHGDRRSITGHPGDQGGYGKARTDGALLCGDVGYGKTEVALRAVMKCILEPAPPFWYPPRCWPSSTMPPPPPSAPSGDPDAEPVPHPQADQGNSGAGGAGKDRLAHRHPHRLWRRNDLVFERIWGCSSSTRSSASA